MSKYLKFAIVACVVVILLNLIYLDYQVLFSQNIPKQVIQYVVNEKNDASPSLEQAANSIQKESNEGCANACLVAIKEATASSKPAPTNAPSQQQSSIVQSVPTASEYFVPLGAGSSSSQTWTTIGGAQAYVNMSQYPNVQSVVFEVSAYVPTGNEIIWIQLYNATDGYAIPGSQVTMNGGTPQLLTSGNMNLPSGNKLYQVQMQTQLTFPAIIEQARLHITTQ